jgi:hypothetical protein
MFDFLKDLGFKAPEEEPQRGTVIQTDEKGKIATMPTEDGKSRIISRDEFRDMQDTSSSNRDFTDKPNYKSYEQKIADAVQDVKNETDRLMEVDYGSPVSAFDRMLQGNVMYDEGALSKNLRLAAQNLYPNSVPPARANVMDGYRKGDITREETVDSDDVSIKNTPMGIDLFRDRDAQARRLTNDFGDPFTAELRRTIDKNQQATKMKAYNSNDPNEIFDALNDGIINNQDLVNMSVAGNATAMEILKKRDANAMFSQGIGGEGISYRPPLGKPSQEVQKLAEEYMLIAYDSGINMNYSQAINMARNQLSGKTGMDEGSFGGNMVGTASKVPAFTTQTTQVGEPNQGITSFADAKKEIKKGKEGGIKGYYRPADFPAPRSQGFIDSYNHPLAKFATPFTDAYGRAIGLDMDTEQGRYDLYDWRCAVKYVRSTRWRI